MVCPDSKAGSLAYTYLGKIHPHSPPVPIMPHFRKSFRRRRTRPRRNRRRFRRRASGMRRKVNIALARSKPERKAKDFPLTLNAVNNLGTVIDPTPLGIFVGTDSNERIGNRLYMRNYDVRYSISYNAGSAFSMQVVRVLWFKWKDTSFPSVNEVLQTASIFSHYNKGNAGIFSIMSDRNYTVGDQGNAVIDLFRRSVMKIRDVWTYSNTIDTIINKNRIFVILISNMTVDFPFYDILLRVNYYDS